MITTTTKTTNRAGRWEWTITWFRKFDSYKRGLLTATAYRRLHVFRPTCDNSAAKNFGLQTLNKSKSWAETTRCSCCSVTWRISRKFFLRSANPLSPRPRDSGVELLSTLCRSILRSDVSFEHRLLLCLHLLWKVQVSSFISSKIHHFIEFERISKQVYNQFFYSFLSKIFSIFYF